MMKKLLYSLFFLLSVSAKAQYELSEQIGNVRGFRPIAGGYEFRITNAYASVTVYKPSVVRVRIARNKPLQDESFAIDSLVPLGRFTSFTNNPNSFRLTTDSLKIEITKKPFRVNFFNRFGAVLADDDTTLGVSWFGDRVTCYKHLHKDEKFIGLGEKTGGINRRGQHFVNWNSDVPGYALNADPLYATLPFFIGIHDRLMYGIFFDNSYRSYFNFGGGADEELFSFGADAGEMNYYFIYGNSVADIVENYTALTGRTPMPPVWSLGFQQSRWGYDSQEQMIELANTFRKKKMPADVLVSDIPYMHDYKIFTWNRTGFPDPGAMMKALRELNFEMVTIVDPGISVDTGYSAYREALAGNHIVKYPGGKPYIGHVWPGRCVFPDFLKKSSREWWGQSFKKGYVDIGIKGFWNDMNEPAAWGREFPNLVEFGEGKERQTLYRVKNAYGSLMSKATYEGTRSLLGDERPFILTRAAYAGIQKYSAMWTGDNVSSDEHMLLGFRLMNSMGVSGVPFTGMDVGGFMGNPSPELFVRWMSLGLYSPLFRNHTHIGYNYREPWLFGETNTIRVRKILEQRYQLLPYLYSVFYEAHTKGYPINRMLPFYYPLDETTFHQSFENQFFHGQFILVCPVPSDKDFAEVYLPGETDYYRLSDEKPYKGGHKYMVTAPLDDLPVFVKASSIIPMQSVVQNTKEKGDGLLYLHVYEGENPSNFTYYEDDGNTYNYEKRVFYKRQFHYSPKDKTLTLSPVEGSYSSKFTRVQVIIHGSNMPIKKEPIVFGSDKIIIAL